MGFVDKIWSWLGIGDEESQEEMMSLPLNQEMGARAAANVVSLHSNKTMKAVVCEPESFDEVQVLADHLKNRRQLILNFENTHPDTARRIVDFISGTVYALEGNCQQLGQYIFIFAPSNFEFSKDHRSLMRKHGLPHPAGGER